MTLACLRTGLRAAARRPRLAVALWLVNLTLAAAAATPAMLAFREAFDRAPAADRLRQGFSFGLTVELLQAWPGRLATLVSFALAAAVLALLANALTSGGVLEVLTTGDDRRFLHRFGRGAGHFFGRFLRVGIAAGLTLVALAGLVAAAAGALARRLEESPWEPMWVVMGGARLGLIALVALVALVALDVARIRLVREDGRRAVRLYWGSLALVLRHPVATLGIWAGTAALFALVLGLYALVRAVAPAQAWAGILFMVLAQQAVMLCRAALRVALFAGEIALVERLAAPLSTPPAVG